MQRRMGSMKLILFYGDILEITRSQIWLDGEDRPYVDNNDIQPGSDLENNPSNC